MLLFYLLFIYMVQAELAFVAQLSRHGIRAPKKYFNFNKDHWEEYELAELTPPGQRQQYLIGAEMRRRYIQEFPLLQPSYNNSQVSVLTTDSRRTMMSAHCQMLGMFPGGTGPDITVSARPPIKVQGVEKLEYDLGKAALPYKSSCFAIKNEVKGSEKILHGYKETTCPRIHKIKESIKQTARYRETEAFYQQILFPRVSKALDMKIDTIQLAASVHGALAAEIANGYEIPSALSIDDYMALGEVHRYSMYTAPFSDPLARVLSCNYFIRDLLSKIENSDKGPKYVLYAGHDNTLIAVMSCLESAYQPLPDYSSMLLFEYYKNDTIRLSYNDKPLELPYCRHPCDYKALKDSLLKYTAEDVEDRCKC